MEADLSLSSTKKIPDGEVFDRSRQFDKKRAALIRMAAIAFHEHGYAGTTLDMIASDLGVTKKALYRYVSGKMEILYKIFCLWLDLQTRAIEVAEAHSGTFSEKIQVYSRTYVEGMFENLVPTERLVGEVHILPEAQRSEVQARRRENDNRLAKIFDQRIATPRHSRNSTLEVHTLNGAVDWIFKWCKENGKLSPGGASDAIIDILMKGFEAHPTKLEEVKPD